MACDKHRDEFGGWVALILAGLLFFVLREIVCWYFKSGQILSAVTGLSREVRGLNKRLKNIVD